MKGGGTLLGLWFSSAQHFIQMLLSFVTAAVLKLSLARPRHKPKKVYTNQPRFFPWSSEHLPPQWLPAPTAGLPPSLSSSTVSQSRDCLCANRWLERVGVMSPIGVRMKLKAVFAILQDLSKLGKDVEFICITRQPLFTPNSQNTFL